MSKKKQKPEKIHTKEQQLAMSKYLFDKFTLINKGQELIPVVLDRATWEEIAYSINLALKLERKKGNDND